MGLKAEDLVGKSVAAGQLGRRTQGFGQARHRALVLDPEQVWSRERFDEKKSRQLVVGGEETQARIQSGRHLGLPLPLTQDAVRDGGHKSLCALPVRGRGAQLGRRRAVAILDLSHSPDTNTSVRNCQDTHVVSQLGTSSFA